MILTEMEKSILLGLLVVTGGSLKKTVKEEEILKHFPIRQRKNARFALIKLTKNKYLTFNSKNKLYKLNELGLKEAKILLRKGAKIWGA